MAQIYVLDLECDAGSEGVLDPEVEGAGAYVLDLARVEHDADLLRSDRVDLHTSLSTTKSYTSELFMCTI